MICSGCSAHLANVANMDDWSDSAEYFMCAKCVHQQNGTYDFKKALARLDDTLTDGLDSFLVTEAAKREQLLLDTYKVTLPPKSPKISPHAYLCNTATEILKRYQPSVLECFTPISVQGDGNCFYRALSLAFWGTQEHHEQLRLRIAIEMMLHRDHYDCDSATFKAKLPNPEIVTPKYLQVLKTAAGWGHFTEMVHFLAASVVIGEPLVSFFPVKGINPQATAYNMTLKGRGVRGNKTVRTTLMWSRVTLPSSDDNGYTPNHFVFLYEKPRASLRNSPPMEINDESDHEVKTSHIIDEIADEEVIVDEKYVKEENLQAETTETDVDNMSAPASELSTRAHEERLLSGGYPLVTGTFLHPKEVLKLLREPNTTPSVAVPAGLKENIYFIIDNTKNCDLKARGHNCDYRDDCGVWLSKKGTSPKAFYVKEKDVKGKDILKSIVKHNERYCLYRKAKQSIAKQSKAKYTYDDLDPQPADSEVIGLQRNYATLKADTNYRRRISWLINSKQKLAVVEYVGKFPGRHSHRNVKVQDDAPDDIRTNPVTLEKNSDSAKHKTPLHPDDSMIQHDASHQIHLVSESRSQPQATQEEDYSMQEEIPISDQLVLTSNPASISDMQIEPAPTLTVQTETVSVPTMQATGKIPDPLMQVEQTPIRTQQIELPPTTSMQNLPIITNREPSPVSAVTETPQAHGLDLTMQRNLTPKHALYLPMKEAPQCHILGLTMETTTSSDHTPSLAVQKKTHHTHSLDSVMQAEISHAYTLGSTMPKEPPSANVIPSTLHTKPCPSNTHSTMQDSSFFPGMDQFHPARMTGPTLQQEILRDLQSPGHSISRSLPSTTFVQASPHSAQSNPSICDAQSLSHLQSSGTTTSQITSHVPPHPHHSIPLSIPPYSFPVQQLGYIPSKYGEYPQMSPSVNMSRSQRPTTEKVKLRVLNHFIMPSRKASLSFGQQLDFLLNMHNNPTALSHCQYTGTCISEVSKRPFPQGHNYSCTKFITPQHVVLQSFRNKLSIYNHELQHIETVHILGKVRGLISDLYAVVRKRFITHQGLSVATLCITSFLNTQEIHHELELPHPKAYDVNDKLFACGLLDRRVAVTKKDGLYVDFYSTVGHHIQRFDLDGCTRRPRCTAQHVLVPIVNQPRTILMFTWSGELIQRLEPLGLDLYDKCLILSPIHDGKLNILVRNASKPTDEIITCEIQDCEEHGGEMMNTDENGH